MNNENFIVICGWMISELGLKSNELLLYALIYGFSQDNQSAFSGSLSYMAKWLNCTKRTVINTLDALEKRGLITKVPFSVNSVTFNEYRVFSRGVKNFPSPSEKFSSEGVKNFHPNINSIDINSDNIESEARAHGKKTFIKPTLDEVKAYCAERGNLVDAEHWFNYYEANGWRVGRNPMKDWKAAVRTWERNQVSTGGPASEGFRGSVGKNFRRKM